MREGHAAAEEVSRCWRPYHGPIGRVEVSPDWVRAWQLRAAVLLVLTVALGALTVRTAPGTGQVVGTWPVGLATGFVLVAPRRAAPTMLGLVGLGALVSLVLADRPAGVVVGYALTIVLETALVARLLLGGRERPWRLRRDADLRRYLAASLLGGVVAAVGGGATSLLTGFGDPGLVALSLGAAHLASQLVFTPLWARLPSHGSLAGRREQMLQWGALAVVAPAVFAPELSLPLVFLVIPLLAWSALRTSPLRALGQLVAVLAFAVAMTTFDRGPFAALPSLLGMALRRARSPHRGVRRCLRPHRGAPAAARRRERRGGPDRRGRARHAGPHRAQRDRDRDRGHGRPGAHHPLQPGRRAAAGLLGRRGRGDDHPRLPHGRPDRGQGTPSSAWSPASPRWCGGCRSPTWRGRTWASFARTGWSAPTR